MSMKIKKIRNYIKETYQRFGEIYYAYYWNLGYLSCLLDEKKITVIEHTGLSGYCDRMHFVEQMKITNRKVQIEKEESKDMGLEEIKKRIDESIKFINLDTNYSSLEYCHDITIEAQKALKIYEELITFIHGIDDDGRGFRTRRIMERIPELEEKYYPKPKTIRERINDIIIGNNVCIGRKEVIDALVKLRDEIPD